MVAESALAKYHWASRYISELIQGPPSPRPSASPEEIRARALARLDRLRQFLAFVGNPQQQYRSVHVGGTSGKGSTSALIASLLHAGGFHVGLHVSPYLQVETEKLQIDGRLLPAERFAEHVGALDGEIKRWVAQGGPPLTYGEFWVALTFFSFAREALDWAVIEVGAGGRFDLTNVLLSDVAVITSIGLDHMRSLGGTIPEIAWHKAGIIKPGRPAVTTVTKPDALEVIAREATETGSKLTHVLEGREFDVLSTGADGTRVLDRESGVTFATVLPGHFQGANVAAAVAAIVRWRICCRNRSTPRRSREVSRRRASPGGWRSSNEVPWSYSTAHTTRRRWSRSCRARPIWASRDGEFWCLDRSTGTIISPWRGSSPRSPTR